MSNIDALVEHLIKSTESDRIQWINTKINQSKFILETYNLKGVSEFLLVDIADTKVCLVKFGSIEERVDLLLFSPSLNDVRPNLTVDSEELEQPHRIWTLFKLAERNATGTDRLIKKIINKLTEDELPF